LITVTAPHRVYIVVGLSGMRQEGAVEVNLSELLPELDRVIEAAETVPAALDGLVALAKDRIPHACDVSMTLVERDRPTTVASTGSLATELDERQYESGWGPCIDAAVSGEALLVRDARTDTRWLEYLPKAVALGMGSSLSTPMPTRPDVAGALNVYSKEPDAFDDDALQLCRSLAAAAALVLAHTRRYSTVASQVQHLEEAMRSRAVIEQAKGILMAIRRCSSDEAFDVLVRHSQQSHVKLREVAARIVIDASGHDVDLEGS
jgi:GAF domain-containing protein